MKNLYKYILIIGIVIAFFSCQEEFEPGGTAIEAMAGTWKVNMGVSDGNGGLAADYGYYDLLTFNTADNSTNTMWVSDDHSFWEYQVKVNINLENLTFSVIQGEDIVWDDTTTINNGKIIPLGATAPSGTVTDSIYFEVEWASDPGTIYIGSGYRYTGWPEDE